MIANKQQRLNCLISLVYVRYYHLYPLENRPQNFDQLGAEIIFGERWKSNVLLRIVVNSLLPIVMCLLDVYLLIKYSIGILTHKKQKLSGDKLFVSFHHRLYSIGKFAGLVTSDTVWFHTPMDSFVLPEPFKTLDVFDYITLTDVCKSMIQSVRCRWYFVYHRGYDNMMISEKCFVWFLTDFALRKIPSNVEIYFANQLDRLAVLIDRLPQQKKSLVEHGVEYLYTESEIQRKNNMLVYHPDVNFYVLNRIYHFHNITRVYCYSDIDIKAFERSIVRCNPQYVVIGYDFKPSFKPSKKSVLIISEYYNQYENEKKVVSSLQGIDIDLYLKGHPGNDDKLYNKLRVEYNFIFIPGKKRDLPDADIVISYDSTLAHEYESIGSKVLYYGNFDINKVRGIVSYLLGL